MKDFQILSSMVEVCQRLHAKNMLASADGNISYKISEREILITPSGLNKAFIKPADIAVITLEGRTVSGKPSSEKQMHLAVYRSCPQARSVVHAHPPVATAWSVAHPEMTELPAECLSEVILAVGRIPIVPYARPGSQEIGERVKTFLPETRVMILARHGALSWGEDLNEAYNGMERVEHAAGILRDAYLLGGLKPLPADEIRALYEMRNQLGERIL